MMNPKLQKYLLFRPHFLGVLFNPVYLTNRHIYKHVKRLAPSFTGRLLDFGCGSKPYKELFINVSDYVGLDYENPGHSHTNEEIDVYYNGKDIPFPPTHFDCLLSTEVLEHVANIELTLKEWHRVLKPKGRLLLTVPFFFPEHEMPHDYRRYTAIGIETVLMEHGFHCREVTRMGTPIETISQLTICYIEKMFPAKSMILRVLRDLLLIAPINIWALILSVVLPKHTTHYRGTLIVAEKVAEKNEQLP